MGAGEAAKCRLLRRLLADEELGETEGYDEALLDAAGSLGPLDA